MAEFQTWMESFCRDEVSKVLEGDLSLLWNSFVWNKTDQGQEFWSDLVTDFDKNGTTLHKEVHDILEGMLAEYDAFQKAQTPAQETKQPKD